MTKEDLYCNHCGKHTKWYKRMINEVGIIEIDKKLYCEECINKIGHIALDCK